MSTAEEILPVSDILNELEQARNNLRDIDDSIRSLTGRTPTEIINFTYRGGRGGPVRGARGSFRGRGRFVTNRPTGGNEEGNGFPMGMSVRGRLSGGNAPDFENDNTDPRRRIQNRLGPPVNREAVDWDDPETNDAAKPFIQSSVTAAPQKTRDEAIEEIKGTEKREIKQRNKRMFQNVLLGTLQRFRNDEKRFKEQERKQTEFEKKLEQMKKDEAEQLIQNRRDLMFKRQAKQAQVRIIQRKLNMVDMVSDWENHMRKLQNFIQTKSKPPIFYLPAKHTMRTIELQKKSVKRLEDLIVHRREKLQKELDELDRNIKRAGSGFRDTSDKGAKRARMDTVGGSDEFESEEENEEPITKSMRGEQQQSSRDMGAPVSVQNGGGPDRVPTSAAESVFVRTSGEPMAGGYQVAKAQTEASLALATEDISDTTGDIELEEPNISLAVELDTSGDISETTETTNSYEITKSSQQEPGLDDDESFDNPSESERQAAAAATGGATNPSTSAVNDSETEMNVIRGLDTSLAEAHDELNYDES